MSDRPAVRDAAAPPLELCEGWVVHHRFRPRVHAFRHRVFYLRVPLSRIAHLGNRWLARNRFNLMSFHDRDYGPRDGSDLATWARTLLARHGFPDVADEIVLQTFPRVLGYVFNPLSLWFVFDRARALRAVICEVNNTFGERHNYLVARDDAGPIGSGEWLTARKSMHVSPFCAVEGHYRFRFTERQGQWTTAIDYHADTTRADRVLATLITGHPVPLDARATLRAFVRHPLFTLGVMARIHWHALRLWLKRVPWYTKPAPPRFETSSDWSSHVPE